MANLLTKLAKYLAKGFSMAGDEEDEEKKKVAETVVGASLNAGGDAGFQTDEERFRTSAIPDLTGAPEDPSLLHGGKVLNPSSIPATMAGSSDYEIDPVTGLYKEPEADFSKGGKYDTNSKKNFLYGLLNGIASAPRNADGSIELGNFIGAAAGGATKGLTTKDYAGKIQYENKLADVNQRNDQKLAQMHKSAQVEDERSRIREREFSQQLKTKAYELRLDQLELATRRQDESERRAAANEIFRRNKLTIDILEKLPANSPLRKELSDDLRSIGWKIDPNTGLGRPRLINNGFASFLVNDLGQATVVEFDANGQPVSMLRPTDIISLARTLVDPTSGEPMDVDKILDGEIKAIMANAEAQAAAKGEKITLADRNRLMSTAQNSARLKIQEKIQNNKYRVADERSRLTNQLYQAQVNQNNPTNTKPPETTAAPPPTTTSTEGTTPTTGNSSADFSDDLKPYLVNMVVRPEPDGRATFPVVQDGKKIHYTTNGSVIIQDVPPNTLRGQVLSSTNGGKKEYFIYLGKNEGGSDIVIPVLRREIQALR